MDNLQMLINVMAKEWQRERAKTQMTLGKMIEALKSMPPNKLIDGITSPHSYRGCYEDLAFEMAGEKITAATALKICQSAMGKMFQGYKGGDFVMGELTPIWIAEYGDCGRKIMAINNNGSIETSEDD